MNGNPLRLYLREAPGLTPQDRYIGRLNFTRLRAEDSFKAGIHIYLEPRMHPEFLAAHQSIHWIALNAEITDQRPRPREFGKVMFQDGLPNSPFPGFDLHGNEIDWLWQLGHADIESIERRRSEAAKSALSFAVDVSGALQIDAHVHMVGGEGNFEVAVSDWENYLATLGYGLPPSAAGLAGAASTAHSSWTEAEFRLSEARRHLRAGEGHEALAACLKAFEAEVSAPYNPASWLGSFNVPGQKEEGLTSAIAGHCAYLNKIGHHRSRTDRDAAGSLPEMPLNQWEAELAVAGSHFWLAYAIRLKK